METGILPPNLRTIEEIFTSDTRYAVPKYQRSFAWGPDEIEELWEDISSAVERKSDYFLGTLVLHKKRDAPSEIIDGQQRLTCVSTIFCAIRNIFSARVDNRSEQLFHDFLGAKGYGRDAPVNPKLILNNVNNDTYVTYLIGNSNLSEIDTALKEKRMLLSNKLLLRAYRYFLGEIGSEVALRGTNADDFLVPLIDCLRNSIKLITIPVMSEEAANLFFESLNARGKELAVSDLVKNRLYFEAKDQVTEAQNHWEKMEAELIRRPIPEYLRHYWIAKKIDEKTGTVREKQLYRMVTQEVKGKLAATLELLKDFSLTASDYAKIGDFNLWPDEEAYDTTFDDSLKALRLFRITQCNPILINAIQVFKKPKDIVKTFGIVANFSFRYFIVGNQSPGNLERVSNTIAVKIRTGEFVKPSDVAEEFRSTNPDAAFRSDFSLVSFSKSRAKLARYTLARMNNHMATRSSKHGAELVVNQDSKQVNLEHVLPQSPTADWVAGFTLGMEPKDYIYRLGNLTLLNAKINRTLADKSFIDKRDLAFESSNLEINKFFRTLSKWSNDEIDQRQRELAITALEVWKI